MKITVERAAEDLKKVAEKFGTVGKGSDLDRLAQMVVQPLQVLQNRLESPVILKMLYLDNSEAREALPESVIQLIEKLCAEELSVEEAKKKLIDLEEMYKVAYEKLGITPQVSQALFFRS